MIKRLDKRGENVLTENIIFIVLNLVFLAILVLFLVSKMGDAAILEEKYAKQIAMIIDSAKPVMEIHLDMEDAFDKKEGVDNNSMVLIDKNVVTVKLREKSKGYSYSFFNNVDVSAYTGTAKEDINKYILMIDPK